MKKLTLTPAEISELADTLCKEKAHIAMYYGADGSRYFVACETAQEAQEYCDEKLQVEIDAATDVGEEPPTSWSDLDESWSHIGERFVIDNDDLDFNFQCEDAHDYEVVCGECLWYLYLTREEFVQVINAEIAYRDELLAKEEEEDK